MSIKTFITDISNGLKAKVDNAGDTEKNGLIVATRPLKILNNKILFFSNPTYGIDMNQSLGASGTAINIHNGIDDVYWTGTNVAGTRFDFNSSVQAYTGSYSIDGSSTINNDESQFEKGSNQDLTGYTSLSGWIYITGWPGSGNIEVQIYGWDVGVGIVGNIINISGYVDASIFNVWQKFIIPLTDFDLTDKIIDSIRIKTVAIGSTPPNYYIDDIQIQEKGLPLEYTVKPALGTWLYIDLLNTIMVDELSTVLADASMYNLSYDKLLGVSELSAGIIVQLYKSNNLYVTATFHSLIDFFQIPHRNTLTTGCDGTNTWLNINQKLSNPILLKSENEDKLTMTIRDDLSDLIRLRMSMSGREEIR